MAYMACATTNQHIIHKNSLDSRPRQHEQSMYDPGDALSLSLLPTQWIKDIKMSSTRMNFVLSAYRNKSTLPLSSHHYETSFFYTPFVCPFL